MDYYEDAETVGVYTEVIRASLVSVYDALGESTVDAAGLASGIVELEKDLAKISLGVLVLFFLPSEPQPIFFCPPPLASSSRTLSRPTTARTARSSKRSSPPSRSTTTLRATLRDQTTPTRSS